LNKYIDKIKNVSLLEVLSNEEINEYLNKNYFIIKNYPKNSIIHMDGDKCKKIEIILSGNVVVDRIDYSGNLFTITGFKEGGLLGANLLFSNNPYYPMTITANKDTVLLEIQKEFLLELLWENKKFLISYLKFSSTNTERLTKKLKHSVNKTIRENIINFLKNKYSKKNSLIINLNMTKKQLAENFGVNRTSLSRELKKMKNEGLIDFDNKSIEIKDSSILD
jgi:CRP-like cAMP-binding protein